jgi:alpha-galactosidase
MLGRRMDLRLAAFLLMAGLLPSLGQSAPAPAAPPTAISADLFKGPALPFGFKYGGKDSRDFLGTWQSTDSAAPATDGTIHTYVYTDPATHLKVTCAVRTFDKFDAVDWVLTFSNEGTSDTPILENIQPLQWTVACDSPGATVHTTRGSTAGVDDFAAVDMDLQPNQSQRLGVGSGRSSDGGWPFFNLQTGDHGLYGAIGWTGDWQANFNRAQDGKSIAMSAGMLATHLLLHPGETIRSPRILLMNWKGGDVAAAQGVWRQLMIDEYSAKDTDGKIPPMPISWDTWGTEFGATKLKVIQGMAAEKIPADLYWIDAGWYPPITLPPGAGYNVGSDWAGHRGNWVLSPNLYPDSMKPLGEALKAAGIGFLVWFEAETASPDAPWVKDHPDWYLTVAGHDPNDAGWPHFLNLGNPAAAAAITSTVSQFITDNELTWYRQDYNFAPAPYWAAADKPDRVGMNEIKSIMGLYKYWDDLRAQHPGLRIDNCASGGRRLDIETASRSVSLWRSDNAGDPIGEQFHTAAMNPWYPMNAGVWITVKGGSPIGSTQQLYEQRSGYSSGMTVCIDQDPAPWIKAAFEEFDEVRPYYMGDFYPLLPPSTDGSVWAAWQCQKLDKSSGVVVVLRRPGSPYSAMQLALKAIDPNANYAVEIRLTRDKGQPVTMKGADLQHLAVAINDKPGSALVFYTKQ